MIDFDYQKINHIIHSRIRLAVFAVLMSVEEAEFTFLREKIKATDGNLSANLKRLEEAGYLAVKKELVNRKPRSTYRLTEKGKKSFELYVAGLETLIKK